MQTERQYYSYREESSDTSDEDSPTHPLASYLYLLYYTYKLLFCSIQPRLHVEIIKKEK